MSADTHKHVSIIIPTRNQVDMLRRLVDGLINTARVSDADIELIIVDNNSDELATLHYLDALTKLSTHPFSAIKLLRYPHTFNYSAINNFAVSHAAGNYLCFLNNDIDIIHPDWLTAMCTQAQHSATGCVGAMLYYPDNTIQHAGVYLDVNKVADHLYKHYPRGAHGDADFLLTPQRVSAVTAACLLIRRPVFDQVGGFNASLAVAFNDVDLCLKVQQAGYTNIWTPHAELYHHESKSRGQTHQRSLMQKLRHKFEVRLMKRTWSTQLANDPHSHAHSPHPPHLPNHRVG